MDNHQLFQTTRIDPVTGEEYTFTLQEFTPNTEILVHGGIPPKEFVLSFFWWLARLSYDLEEYPEVKNEARNLLPLVDWAIISIEFKIKLILVDDEEKFDYNYAANFDKSPLTSPDPNIVQPPSSEFMRITVEEILNSQALMLAMVEYLRLNREELETRARKEYNINDPEQITIPLETNTTDSVDAKKRKDSLFPNSKAINMSSQWAMPQFIANNLNRGIKKANRLDAIEQYNRSAAHPSARKPNYKIKNKGQDSETEFVFDKDKLAIKTAEQFADKLMKLKDAKVLQTFFALMKWINQKDTFVFRNVPISDIMELVLKPSGANKFNTPQRKEFSEVLEYLASVSITVSVIGERVNKKTGTSKPVLQQESGVKLFRFVAEYSVRKEFQSYPKESLREDIHFDKTVITRFSGEILPGNAHLFGRPGSVYFDSLLNLDANKDSNAILMGFNFQTRFNQLKSTEKHIELDRPFLIELCDYQKTNKTKPSKATKQIANNLDKLIQAGIISKYSGLTNKDEDRVKIYPPNLTALST